MFLLVLDLAKKNLYLKMLTGFSKIWVGYKKAIVEHIINLSLSIGSVVKAAAFIYKGYTPAIVAITSSIDFGHIHLMGKLIVVKLKLPFNIFFPTLFKISLAELLNLELSSLSIS